MEIGWFTLVAQIINFLVLVWLLKRLLYGRVIRAMNEREAKIAGRLEEAAQKRAEAEREAELYRARNREWEDEHAKLLARTKEEAETRRQQLIEEARAEADKTQAEWLDALKQEQKALLEEFRERMGQQVFAVARRVLRDLADADLEQQVVAGFLDRLERLDPPERDAIVAAIRVSDQVVEIHSAFPLGPEMRDRVSRALRTHLDDAVDVRFTQAPELICGVELRAHSHRLAWNLESYLDGLEECVFEALDNKARENGKPQASIADRTPARRDSHRP